MNEQLLEILMCPLTGGPIEIESFERQGAEIEFGVLTGDGGEYPIVNGIPILKTGQSEIVSLLRAGKFTLATATACVSSKYVPVLSQLMTSGAVRRKFRRFTKPLEGRLRQKWLASAAEVIDRHLRQGSAQDLFEYFYRGCDGDSPEAYYYNYCRFGMPGQFVALSFSYSLPRQSGLVLDHSCGAGHLMWGLTEAVSPAQVVGQDISFFSLLVARHFNARKGWHVCNDIAKLPFRDGVFSTVFNSDAYTNFSAKLSAFQEMERCATADASILLVWMRNKNLEQLYTSKPLTPEAYRRIVAHRRHRLIPDAVVLKGFFEGSGVRAAEEHGGDVISNARTFSLWIEKGDRPFPNGPAFHRPIVPVEAAAVNPIYQPVGRNGGSKSLVLRFPSEFYAQEDKEMNYYYPPSYELSAEQQKAIASGSNFACLENLLQTGAVVGVPKRYLRASP